ncbi:MAG: outer membrane protein OmpA [Labilithrix sp.]|nr:outer membrane protein OmpA [Labilithrix sp.]
MRRAAAALVLLGAATGVSTVLAAFPRSAEARECTSPLVNTCINSDTYWPSAGPMRLATVNGTETVGSGQVGFGLVATWQSRPVILHVASPGAGGSDQYVVDDQVTGNFLFAYGVTERLQLDFALPVTFVQTGAGVSPLSGGADLKDTAVRDLRFGVAYQIVPRARISPGAYTADARTRGQGGVADPMKPGHLFAVTARMTFSAPTGDSGELAGERSVVFAPNVAADLRYGRIFAGLDLGARLRPVTELAGARVGSQLTGGLGAGVDLLPRELLAITAEARAYVNFAEQHDTTQSAFGITSTPNGSHITPAEWLVAAHSAPLFAGDMSFFVGGGGPIPTGDAAITAPRFRFVLGAVYAPTARDTDGDGIPDKLDQCPAQAGVRGGEQSGCPASATPSPSAGDLPAAPPSSSPSGSQPPVQENTP